MNKEIGTEAEQFLFREYINGIFVAVQRTSYLSFFKYIYFSLSVDQFMYKEVQFIVRDWGIK
jgi:hypothetical protein